MLITRHCIRTALDVSRVSSASAAVRWRKTERDGVFKVGMGITKEIQMYNTLASSREEALPVLVLLSYVVK